MIKAAIKHSIDRILFSSLDRKWTLNKIERLKQKFKRISKEVEIISSNSDQELRTDSGYLPGGMLSILIGRIIGMKRRESERKDPLGHQNLFNIEGNNKVIKIFTIHRITESTTPGIMKSKVQYDRSTGKVKTTREY